jgi:Domain of unknown function (DUF5658)
MGSAIEWTRETDRTGGYMHLFRETFLLFSLNLLDALLTLVWIRHGVATEGNDIMAQLLEVGDGTFLVTKIAIGAITAFVLFRFGNLRLAQYGLTVALAVYISLLGIHVVTGLSAFGLLSKTTIHNMQVFADGLMRMI